MTTTTWYEREGDGFVEREHAMETSESERIVVHEVANIAPEGRGVARGGSARVWNRRRRRRARCEIVWPSCPRIFAR